MEDIPLSPKEIEFNLYREKHNEAIKLYKAFNKQDTEEAKLNYRKGLYHVIDSLIRMQSTLEEEGNNRLKMSVSPDLITERIYKLHTLYLELLAKHPKKEERTGELPPHDKIIVVEEELETARLFQSWP